MRPSPSVSASFGIGAVDLDLLTVGEAVVVAVGVQRIGAVDVDLVAVGEPVVVAVGVERVGAVDVDLGRRR